MTHYKIAFSQWLFFLTAPLAISCVSIHTSMCLCVVQCDGELDTHVTPVQEHLCSSRTARGHTTDKFLMEEDFEGEYGHPRITNLRQWGNKCSLPPKSFTRSLFLSWDPGLRENIHIVPLLYDRYGGEVINTFSFKVFSMKHLPRLDTIACTGTGLIPRYNLTAHSQQTNI